MTQEREKIETGRTWLGIEFGSTRIKAVLIDHNGTVLGMGVHDWENTLMDGIWTYPLEEIGEGLRACYRALQKDIRTKYGVTLEKIGAMGISAMMHGYMAFDQEGRLLAPFQTWRNSNTQQAADQLTRLFQFNIPLRWTIAHLYQRILDGAAHLEQLDFVTTLASYIHWKLTGRKVTGIGDASGIFPIDSAALDYQSDMIWRFDQLVEAKGYAWRTREILPEVLTAGEIAGHLTEEGAAFLDPSGNLKPGVPMCPPEGDAGTGMVATNSVAPETGNVSAGTSTFAMIVLKQQLSRLHREIDMVTTPEGFPVAMAHANNGTSDLNAWISLFGEFAELMGLKIDADQLYERLYTHSLTGDEDCGGLLPFGYYSGEGITKLNEGRPLFARTPGSRFDLANFMRSHLYASLGAVKMGIDILLKEEGVKVSRITGHGGFFKTPGVGQRYLAAAVGAPVTVMAHAGEGGAWGMAILAAFSQNRAKDQSLEDYLGKQIFSAVEGTTLTPAAEEIKGFDCFAQRYQAGLSIEKAAIQAMNW